MFSLWQKIVNKSEARPRTNRIAVGQRVYLDHAAATPMFPAVQTVMLPYLGKIYGNASAVHNEGQMAKRAVQLARHNVARQLGVQPTGIVFTSGGTEGNNLAIMGVVEAYRQAGRPYQEMEIISTAIEHPATSRTLDYLASLGVVIKQIAVNENGHIKLTQLSELLHKKTILVCVTYINSEIGTIERVRQIKRCLLQVNSPALLYVDGAQAPLWEPCQLARLGADLITFDGGKCGGPQGVGILAMTKFVKILPRTFGGGQERGLRSGTEPTALLVAMAKALELAQADYEARTQSVRAVRDEALLEIVQRIPKAILNGPTGKDRVANNINISIPGIDSEYAAVVLDTYGVAVSTKSACSSAGGGESVVVKATTHDTTRASSTLRLTLGPTTTTADMHKCINVLVLYLEKFYIYKK